MRLTSALFFYLYMVRAIEYIEVPITDEDVFIRKERVKRADIDVFFC